MNLALSVVLLSTMAGQAPALRIVVIEGEDAVNVVQQKTAVRPLVEVRDRNDLPVAGATVTFTIGGGSPAAFAGGAQTLTVTTNAAGQAAATGLNAVSNGAFQIQVQAAYQGQIATAAIAQTNVATAAAASQTAAGAGGAAGGAGISGTTIGIVGAAVAGGAVAAVQLTRSGEEGEETAATGRRFTTQISESYLMTTVTTALGTPFTCVSTRLITGTISITLRSGNSNGNLETTGTIQEQSVSGSTCSLNFGSVPFSRNGDITGGPSNLTYLFETTSSSAGTAPTTVTVTSRFAGALSGDTITGTFTYQESARGTGANNSLIQGSGQANFPVTLR